MKTISVVINLDTRAGWLEDYSKEDAGRTGPANKGTRSLDYLMDGVENKRRFFHELPLEIVLYIDVHEPLPDHVLAYLHRQLNEKKIDVLCFSRHRETLEGNLCLYHSDLAYVDALSLARGNYVAHFDADMAAFSVDSAPIREWLDMLDREEHDFICYPSKFSPRTTNDPAFDYMWASTRFFLCLRSRISDNEEIRHCLRDPDYLYRTYGERKMRTPWTEHILGLMADRSNGGHGVWYPPMDAMRYLIFSWTCYYVGILGKLNALPYVAVRKQVHDEWGSDYGGIYYPCDITPKPLP